MGPEGLTSREHEIMRLVCEGMTMRQVASNLGSAPATVRTMMSNIRLKLGVHSMTHAAVVYTRWECDNG